MRRRDGRRWRETRGEMDVSQDSSQAMLTAIHERRSVGAVRPDAPPRELIERVVEAGRWAPNHHLSQPWRFFVLSGSARNALGDAMAAAMDEGDLLRRMPTDEARERA